MPNNTQNLSKLETVKIHREKAPTDFLGIKMKIGKLRAEI